jgi:hypothetical protein
MARATPAACSVPLFERLPERLVLEGYRRWMAGYASGDLSQWEEAWNLHAGALGPSRARLMVDRLAQFVRVVRDWSTCPIACFPQGCRHICRQECFALGIVSASQHGDLGALSVALRHLIDPEGHEEAILPALAYAQALRDQDLVLTPVPEHVIEEIAGRPAHERLH